MFEYGGRMFSPYRLFTKAENTLDFISLHTVRDFELGFMSKDYPESKTSYSYAEFYKKSSIKNCDLFVCADEGKLYCPGENELFEWQGEVGKSDFDRKPHTKSQKEYERYADDRRCKEVYLQLFDPQESLQVGGLECERVDMK